MTLAQLTEIALTLNPRTRQAWLQARAEAAQLGIDTGTTLPQISGTVTYRIGRPVSGTSGLPNATRIDQAGNASTVVASSTPFVVFTQYGPTLNLSYTLYDFGRRAADIEATEFRILAANLAQNRALQEVAFQVEQAYYRILGFEHLVRTSGESVKNFETALDAAKRRHESGLATIGDVYRAETQIGQARLVKSRNEGELSKARGLLAAAVGLSVDFPLKLYPVTDFPAIAQVAESVDGLLAKAKAERPDLAGAEARARAARSTAVAASKAGLPVLEAQASYGRVLFTNALTGQDVYNVGLNLRIPIFSGYSDTYSVRRAEENARQAENVRDQLFSQTELDVWQSYFDLQTAASSIDSTKNLVTSAGQSAAASVARYQAGVGSLIDLITAQLDDTNAKAQQIQSYLDWYLALARLNFSLGASDRVGTRGAVR